MANFRKIDYFDAKKEVISYFIKYNDCFLDEIAIDLELDFELVLNILNDLLLERRIVKISNEELSEKRALNTSDEYVPENSDNILKFEGKRLIVESRSRSYEFISIRHNADYKTILKNRGIVVNNASVILSEAYSFVN